MKSSSVSPGKPVIRVVRRMTPGTFSRILFIREVRLSRSPLRFMALRIFPEACCRGISIYLTIFSSQAIVSSSSSVMESG